MSFFLIASGQDLESLELDSYEIPLDPIARSSIARARVNHDGLRISVDITSDAMGTLYQGNLFGLDKDDVLIAVFGWCTECVDGVHRRFDRQSAQRLMGRVVAWDYETAGLDGNYCLLAYTRKTGTVFIAGNYWPWLGFCYASSDRYLAISNRSAVLADIFKRPVDGIAYLSLLRDLPLPPERTLFSGVRSRLPGECLLIHAGSRAVTSLKRPLRKWEFTGDPSVTAREEITKIVVDSCSDVGAMVDLTGGQDTRVTAAILSKHPRLIADYGLTFKTVGDENHPDVILASRIARLYGWNHLVLSKTSAAAYDWDRFRFATLLFDGSTIPDEESVQRLFREAAMSDRFPTVVGSWGCDFLRDNYFLPEYALRLIGMTKDVGGYVMTRARPDNDIEVTRVSTGILTMSDHDDLYLNIYRQFWNESAGPLANKLNDAAALRIAQKRRDNWAFGAFRRTALPYTTDRAYAIATSLGVRARIFNRFVSSVVCDADEKLGAIHTDRGVHLQPFGARTVCVQARYYIKEAARVVRDRLAVQRSEPSARLSPLPEAWEDHLDTADPFYEYASSFKARRPDPQHHRELLCVLMMECLQNRYRRIVRGLDFSC